VLPRLLSALRDFLLQVWDFWSALPFSRKVFLLLLAAAVFGGLWYFRARMVEEAFRPLYTDLTDKEAGAAVAQLQEMQVPYRLAAGGGTILIPKERIPEVRLQLANAGLPQGARLGFELFDEASFGATDFAEQVNFRRALEGELERSVLSLEEVRRVRVHISLPKKSVFLDQDEPAKASVVVELKPGRKLSDEQVQSIAFLTASAVEGLAPDQVVVVDTLGNLLARPTGEQQKLTSAQLDFQRRVEEQIARNIRQTVEPLVGFDKLRTSVVADIDWSRGEQTEEILDPNTVTMKTQRAEETSQPVSEAGVPGTPSNLPREAERPRIAARAQSRTTETSEYQTSRTVTRLTLERGAVKRLSVALLVDQKIEYDPETAEPSRIPRSPEEIEAIRELTAAAAGIMPERGDVLNIESLPFTIFEPPPEPPPEPAPPPEPTQFEIYLELLQKYRYQFLTALGVVLILAVLLRWWLRRRKIRARIRAEREAALAEEQARKEIEAAEEEARRKEAEEAMMLKGLRIEALKSSKGQVMKKHVEEMARKDTQAFVQLLRSWIHEDDR